MILERGVVYRTKRMGPKVSNVQGQQCSMNSEMFKFVINLLFCSSITVDITVEISVMVMLISSTSCNCIFSPHFHHEKWYWVEN